MSNIVPLVKIKLDKVRHLRLDLNAMVAFERVSGKSITAINTNSSMEELLYLLWACLKHEDKELTVEDVGGLVHAGNMAEISEKLAEAFQVTVPTSEGDPKN